FPSILGKAFGFSVRKRRKALAEKKRMVCFQQTQRFAKGKSQNVYIMLRLSEKDDEKNNTCTNPSNDDFFMFFTDSYR
ncbi:MAG: hypothetical protein KJ655_00205, partial [Candidatus Thermoplasmatota archaeon]|nr:hypothetical protein [Candidatus Thermoplasmatota archaeon]